MNIRVFSLLVAISFASAASLQSGEHASKGIGLWRFEGYRRGVESLGVAWFYNWEAQRPASVNREIEFVPMIWGAKDVTKENLRLAKKSGRILLGFNEPDTRKQANMTVERALELWPQLQATGMRLGSPAPAKGADSPDSWLGRFMKGAAEKGLRVDFICVHNYQADFSDPRAAALRLRQYLEKVYALHRKPLWLTEFALADWKTPATAEQQRAYMKEVLPMLEKLPFLERYAWFALPPNPRGDGGALAESHLCDHRGELNTSGREYRDFGSRKHAGR